MTIETETPDRIEKEIFLRAPRSRVWRAISDSAEFGKWFRIQFDGPFVPGKAVQARLVAQPEWREAPLKLDLAKLKFEFHVEKIEPESLFSYRWHPAAIDVEADYSSEPHTLVTFTLEDAPGGTRLRVSESGFHALPAARRAYAFGLNESGWAEQVRRIEAYVAQAG